jgi:hypothetical protein
MRLTLFVDGEPVWDDDQPLMQSATEHFDEYPFVWLHGEWMPECDRDDLKLQSFTRGLRSTTRARNRRINQMLDIVETRIQNLRLVRMGSLVDKEAAYSSGQAEPVFIKEKAPGPLTDHFVQLPSPDLPPGLFQLCELLEQEETQAKGLNEEIFGSDDKENVPGVLARFRTGQALTGQQGIFDSYRQAKRQIGRKAVKLNQGQIDEQRASRILGEAPDPEFYQADFAKYDCTPVEAMLTEDQQVAAVRELVGLIQVVPKLADLIPASFWITMSPVSYKKELLQTLQANEQQAQQAAQYQMQNQKIMNDLIASQTQVGIAKAQAEVSGARLDAAKTMTEIQALQQQPSMDKLDRVIKLIDLSIRSRQVDQKPQLTGKSK